MGDRLGAGIILQLSLSQLLNFGVAAKIEYRFMIMMIIEEKKVNDYL
jgi:hypothetical protein